MSLPAASFHEVYEAYGREVYRFALYLTGHASRAGELTAEAFLRLCASPAPAHINTMKSYLLAIVRNLYVQTWRRERRETPPVELPSPARRPEQAAEGKAEPGRVLLAMQQLDPVERAAVLLRGEHGMDYESIARMLDITSAAARVKVHRARQKLLQARKGTATP